MIELMDDGTADVVSIRATGKLSRTDYRDVLVPHIRSRLSRFPTLKVLFLLDEGFEGWSLGAAWDNTVLDVRHRRDFEKVAVVGAPRWEQWCVNAAASLLMKGELRTFRLARLADARQWLQT
ncbi:STAS/SEC14 domain-containing protein [Mycolicibacterium moriokaense]|nr:STAS/SEC14 domain-containing protein [Mycolicibacterium moriokaense]